jgi:peroxiredoxin
MAINEAGNTTYTARERSGQFNPVTLRIPYLIAAAIALVSVIYLANPPGLRAAPVLTVTSLDGNQFNLAAMDGKTRLVTFVSPDCPVSKRNLPVLDTLQNRFGSDALEVVGITMPYDSVKEVNRFRTENNIPFQMVSDSDGTIADAFVQVRFTPTSFLIDGDGNIAERIVGRLNAEDLGQQISALSSQPSLAQQSVTVSQ